MKFPFGRSAQTAIFPRRPGRNAAKHINSGGFGKLLSTRFFRWITGVPEEISEPDFLSGLTGRIMKGLSAGFAALRLDRILKNSLFLRPELWLFLTLLLLPFVPTLAMLACSAAVLLSLILFRASGQGKGLRSPGLRYAGLLSAVYLAAALLSVSPRDSLYPGILTAFFMLFSLGSFGAVRSWSALRRMFAVITVGAVLVSLYGFWQWANPAGYESVWLDESMFSAFGLRVYSTFQNPNVLGEYLILTLPFAAALALTAANRRKKLLWALAAAAMFACALLTYSRGCYIGLALAAVVFLVLLDRRFLIPAVILLLLSPLYLPASITQRILSIGSTADTSTNYRVLIWQGVAAMLRQFWYCGIGPGEGAFNMVYPIFALDAVDAPHSHCLYLQLLCDTGITGLLVFLLLAGAVLRSLLSTVRHAKRRETQVFASAAAAAVCGFLLQSATDYSFYNYRVLLLFFGLVGLCFRMRHEDALLEGDGTAGSLAASLTAETRPVVLQILSDSNLGGAGRYLLNLFSAFDRERYAMVLVLPRGAKLTSLAEAMGIPVIEANMQGEKSLDLRGIFELRRICILLRPELIQTHGSLSGRIAARACTGKIIYTRHSTFPVSPRLSSGIGHVLSAALQRRYTDIAVAVSPAAADNLRELGMPEKRITTVMNGTQPTAVLPEEQKQKLRAQFGIGGEETAIGLLARLEPYKGQSDLILAAKALLEQGMKIKVFLAGTGSSEEALRGQIARLGLGDQVVLTGFLEDVAPLLNVLDIQVNASTGTEATSLSLIEGMSLGLPSVVSDFGGNPWLIEDGVTGLVYPAGDPEALTQCLGRVVSDRALRRTLGEQALAAYRRSYTAEVSAARLQEVYAGLLERGRKGS